MFSRMICRVLPFLMAGAIAGHTAESARSSITTALKVAPASDEGELAIKRFRVAKGLKVELFAAEPLLANPVAFCIDERGRFYVAETFRLHAGVTDIRGHMGWLDEELASRSVEERVAYLRKHEARRISEYTRQSDRVRLIWDSDGDGRADQATVFADGFNDIADGLGSGLLARRGNVYYANVPHLWLLRDEDRNGVADSKRSLLYGFGVRVGFLGHDLHGLRIGPDGKLYFSMGDRGANVGLKDGRTISNPEEGAVYRCDFDGSNLEVFAHGFRNPQELAFDELGNLWTGDNNSDGGDPARWVYVVEGGDSGWRVGFQFLNNPSRGVWMTERMCYPQWTGQPAHIIPPVANIGNGPSGLTYYPGVGLPWQYRNHFFLCDFRGTTGSGIHAFKVEPKGAGYEVVGRHDFIWEVLVTDADFGYDGSLYLTDWVEGWNKTGKGRIYRVFDPERVKDRSVTEAKALFAGGFDNVPGSRLEELLAHQDMRVRQEAQFTIVENGPVRAARAFTNVLRTSTSFFARLHALWGLGQVATKSTVATAALTELLHDPHPELRAQAAKVLGDGKVGPVQDLISLVTDDHPRVRYHAAMALGKHGPFEAMSPVVEMLRANDDKDVYVRHAGVMALTGILRSTNAEPANVATKKHVLFNELATDSSPAVRMAVLLTLRRMESPAIAQFLRDENPWIVAEAARAINDLPITNALPRLAALIEESDKLLAFPAGDATRPGPRDAVLRRVLNANFRVGSTNHALALADFAATSSAPEGFRVEALTMLGEWSRPSSRDRITGLWRALVPRDPDLAVAALRPHLAALQNQPSPAIQLSATRVAGRLNIADATAGTFELLKNPAASSAVRVEALRTLVAQKDPRTEEALQLALASNDEALRAEGAKAQAQLHPDESLVQLQSALEAGSLSEKQSALAALGSLSSAAADPLLLEWLDKLLARQVAPELQLDVLEAAARRTNRIVQARLRAFEDSRPSGDDLRSYRESLLGGNAEVGKRIFIEKAEVSCIRCHKFEGEGTEVGPDLTGIGAKQSREYLVESIVFPNKHIAPGFESLLITMKNGSTYAGTVKSETDEIVEINSPEDGVLQLKKAEIKNRERGLSGMPEELRQVLSKMELRDLVEFLSSSKGTPPPAAPPAPAPVE